MHKLLQISNAFITLKGIASNFDGVLCTSSVWVVELRNKQAQSFAAVRGLLNTCNAWQKFKHVPVDSKKFGLQEEVSSELVV